MYAAVCRPAGKLKVTVKATWLNDAKVDVDALTELSFGTQRSTEAGDGEDDFEEQVSCLLLLELLDASYGSWLDCQLMGHALFVSLVFTATDSTTRQAPHMMLLLMLVCFTGPERL